MIGRGRLWPGFRAARWHIERLAPGHQSIKRASAAVRIWTPDALRCRSRCSAQVDAAQATLQGAVRAASYVFTGAVHPGLDIQSAAEIPILFDGRLTVMTAFEDGQA